MSAQTEHNLQRNKHGQKLKSIALSAEPASVISKVFQPKKAQWLDENLATKWPGRRNPKDKKTRSEIALAWQPCYLE